MPATPTFAPIDASLPPAAWATSLVAVTDVAKGIDCVCDGIPFCGVWWGSVCAQWAIFSKAARSSPVVSYPLSRAIFLSSSIETESNAELTSLDWDWLCGCRFWVCTHSAIFSRSFRAKAAMSYPWAEAIAWSSPVEVDENILSVSFGFFWWSWVSTQSAIFSRSCLSSPLVSYPLSWAMACNSSIVVDTYFGLGFGCLGFSWGPFISFPRFCACTHSAIFSNCLLSKLVTSYPSIMTIALRSAVVVEDHLVLILSSSSCLRFCSRYVSEFIHSAIFSRASRSMSVVS